MTQEALKALIHEMEYVLSCINAEEIPFDGDSFHEALRLGKEALDYLAKEKEALAQPEQEPVQARTVHITWNADGIRTVNGVPDYTPPPQRTEKEPVKYSDYEPDGVHHNKPKQDTIQRLSALVRTQQITIDKLEAQTQEPVTHCEAGPEYCPVCQAETQGEE